MKKYRIGIIGYGGFGKFLHYWWAKLDNVEVVAIADHGHRSYEVDRYRGYSNWRDLIEDVEIDIVSIVTPPGMHAEMAIAAMKAGKHVVLEKPVAITEESAQSILDTQRETGMVITVNHMIRYNAIIGNFVAMRENGLLGKLRHAVVNNYAQDEALPADHWFWNETQSGGILVEHGVHFFDIVNAIGGQHVQQVCGTSDRRNESQRDRVAAMVRYDGGLIANYYHAFSGPGMFEKTTIQLAFDLARIEIEGWMPLKGKIEALVNRESKAQLEKLPGWTLLEAEPLHSPSDDSRPEGWGEPDSKATSGKKPVIAGGVPFDVDERISATFEIAQTKGEVYGKCVQSILLDVIGKIENPDHRLTITVEDAVIALKTAVLASE